MVRMLRTLPFALALAALSIFTAGCGSGSGTKFRVVNAIPNAPAAADVLVDGKVVETAVSFPTAAPATGYSSISSGSRHMQLFPTGTTTGAYFDGNITFNSGTAYTLVATGYFTTNTIVMPQFTDTSTAPTSGNSELRIIQASPAGLGANPAVDIYIVAPGGGLPGTSPDITVSYQSANAKTLPAGTYDLLLTPAGIASLNITIPGVSFSSGKIYTYVLVDVANGGFMSSTPVVLNDN